MLQKLFGFDRNTMTLRKEVLGGITSFLTMAYILAVNPSILGDAGMDSGAVFTATVVSAIIATLIMAIYAKLPFVQAPGMGLNAFFAYTIVLTMGYTWQFALTAVFIEGLIFILLTLTGLRTKLVELLPAMLRKSITPGIGFFIMFIGFQNSGIIVSNDATIVTLGDLHSAPVILACFGIILCSILLIRKVRGALLIGILTTTAVGIPLGITHFSHILSTPPSMSALFCKFEWQNIMSLDMVVCVFTLLFMDIFDTIGTLIGVCHRAGMMDKDGKIPGLQKAFMADAVGTTVGAMIGTSTVTTFVESASGVDAGGRSGLTAFTAAVCFALSLFLAPLFLSIPTQATSPALILVGVMMMNDFKSINFEHYVTAVPCILCVILMPLTYSISDGILLSVIAWVMLHLLSGKYKNLSIGIMILAVVFILKYIFL